MPKPKERARSAAYDELTPADVRAALLRRQEQQVEYGTWVASMDITVPFQASLAYSAGSPVPVSNVERWDYDKPTNYMGAVCVVLQDSDEGRALLDPNSTTARVAAVMDGMGAMSNVSEEILMDPDVAGAPKVTPAPRTGSES